MSLSAEVAAVQLAAAIAAVGITNVGRFVKDANMRGVVPDTAVRSR